MSNGGSGKGKVVAGVFIGMVLGIAAAGGVAWYVLQKNSAEFTVKEPHKEPSKPAVAPPVVTVPVAAAPVVAASGVGEAKQHFEFYKVLTDKSDGTPQQSSGRPVTKPKETVAVAKPQAAATKDLYFVQAGSFQNVGDAEKLKAKLAFSGFEASIQTATIPDKGVWHRVRLGPFSGSEAGKTVAALAQNNIIATQLRAQ